MYLQIYQNNRFSNTPVKHVEIRSRRVWLINGHSGRGIPHASCFPWGGKQDFSRRGGDIAIDNDQTNAFPFLPLSRARTHAHTHTHSRSFLSSIVTRYTLSLILQESWSILDTNLGSMAPHLSGTGGDYRNLASINTIYTIVLKLNTLSIRVQFD